MASVGVGWVSTLNAPPATSGQIAAPLVTVMTEFGDSLRALLRPVTPAAVIMNVTLECGVTAAPVTLDLGALTTFNAVMSREDMADGQRVLSYEVEHDESGTWQKFALGGTGVGPPVTPVGQCSDVINGTNLVTGGNPGSAHCIGLTETAEACAQICMANSSCHFYTWHDDTTGLFKHKCFLRDDNCFSGHQQDGHFSGVCNHTGVNGTVPLRSSCGGEWTPALSPLPGIHGSSIGARMIDFVPLTAARKVRLRCTGSLKGAPASARLLSFSVHRGDPPPQPDGNIITALKTTDEQVVPTTTPALAETVGDRLWMWAHPAGFHDNYFSKFGRFPKGYRSRITPVEAAVRMNLRNVMFVYESTNYTHCERGEPHGIGCFPQSVQALPQYMMPFDSPFFKQVAYSVSGGGVGYPSGYTEGVLEQLPKQNNSCGVLFDDFVYGKNTSLDTLRNMSEAVAPLGKDVFLCLYTHELLTMPEEDLLTYLQYARRPMLWMANTGEIANLTANWELLETILAKLPPAARKQVKPMVGLYMFDYLTNDAEMPPALMESQLETALTLLRNFTSNQEIYDRTFFSESGCL